MNWLLASCHNSFLPDLYEGLRTNNCKVKVDSLGDAVKVAANLIQAMLTLAGVLAVIFIIIGGINYITSQGNPQNTANARSMIVNAVVGLIVSILAWAIVGFISGSFKATP